MTHLRADRSAHHRALAVAISLVGIVAATAPTSAQRGYANETERPVVTAYSRYGNGEISAAVRPAKYSPEVRLPGGTWVSCRRSCAETLRVETIDRDEGNSRDIGSGGLLNECGVFGCLEIRHPQ